MKTTAWRKVFAICLGASLFAAGCVISSDDDDDDDGGTGGTGGSGATGGTGGSSGSGGTGGTGGTPHTYTCSETVDDECVTCLQKQCCGEFLACANGDRATPCWGNSGEFFCIQGGIADLFNSRDGGAVSDEEKLEIAGNCAKKSVISTATNDLFACVNSGDRADGGTSTGCAVECFGN